MAVDHEFGAQHTELKLSIAERYLKAFTRALQPHFKQLWYIDAFAGTGSRTIDVEPKFGRLIFMDTMPAHCAALRELSDQDEDRNIVIVEGDANRAIQSEIAIWAEPRRCSTRSGAGASNRSPSRASTLTHIALGLEHQCFSCSPNMSACPMSE
jgi:hypothetical protein